MRCARIPVLLLVVALLVPASSAGQDTGKKITGRVLEVSEAQKIIRYSPDGIGWRDRDEQAPEGKKWLQVVVEVEMKVAEPEEATSYSVGKLKLVDESSNTYGFDGANISLDKPWKFVGETELYMSAKDGIGKGKFVLLFAVPSTGKRFLLHIGDAEPLKIDLEKQPATTQPRKSAP